jgi:hypothetical protein
MALQVYPVTIPYRLTDDSTAATYSLRLESLASQPRAALATARILLETHSLLRHRRRPRQVLLDRSRVQDANARINTPYAYVFTHGDQLPHIALPRDLDANGTTNLIDILNGFSADWVRCLLIDCAPLRMITSTAIGALVEHASRFPIHLFRLPERMHNIMTTVGIDTIVPVHASLQIALEHLSRSALLRQGNAAPADAG